MYDYNYFYIVLLFTVCGIFPYRLRFLASSLRFVRHRLSTTNKFIDRLTETNE